MHPVKHLVLATCQSAGQGSSLVYLEQALDIGKAHTNRRQI